jgi:hypothetical protein
MSLDVQELTRSYVLHGRGGITTVQTRLAAHGNCLFTFWVPCPPDWRVRYTTHLNADEVKQILEDVMIRYGIRLYQETVVYGGSA